VLAQRPKATEDWIVIKEKIKRHEVKDITLIGQEESAVLAQWPKATEDWIVMVKRGSRDTLPHL